MSRHDAVLLLPARATNISAIMKAAIVTAAGATLAGGYITFAANNGAVVDLIAAVVVLVTVAGVVLGSRAMLFRYTRNAALFVSADAFGRVDAMGRLHVFPRAALEKISLTAVLSSANVIVPYAFFRAGDGHCLMQVTQNFWPYPDLKRMANVLGVPIDQSLPGPVKRRVLEALVPGSFGRNNGEDRDLVRRSL